MKSQLFKPSLRLSACIAVAMWTCAAFAADPAADAVDRLVTAQDLAAMVSGSKDGTAKAVFWTGANYNVRTLSRSVPGEVEVHDRVSDVFIVQEGAADMLLGGTAQGGKITEPGELRGGTITGGHVRQIGPGDVLWIPAGMPHQVAKVSGAFRYLVVKIVRPD